MPRSVALPVLALGIALVGVVVAFILDTGGPSSRDAALLVGTFSLWAAAAAVLWLLVAIGLLVARRRRSQ